MSSVLHAAWFFDACTKHELKRWLEAPGRSLVVCEIDLLFPNLCYSKVLV